MGKVSHVDKIRMQMMREQGFGAKAIIRAYPHKQWKLSTVHCTCDTFPIVTALTKCSLLTSIRKMTSCLFIRQILAKLRVVYLQVRLLD